MKWFIWTIVAILTIFAYTYLSKYFTNVFHYFFTYISLTGSHYGNMTISVFDNNIYMQILLWLTLLSISLISLVIYEKINLWGDRYCSGFGDYFIVCFIIPILCVTWILLVIIFFIGFSIILNWLSILLYNIFDIRFFLEHNFTWILGWIITVPWLMLATYLYEKHGLLLSSLKEKVKSYILTISIILLLIIFLVKPSEITFGENNLCINGQCYWYSDVKSIDMDQSGYEIEIVLKSFGTKIPLSFSRHDMIIKEDSDWDEESSYSWVVHEPITTINDRISYIIKEEDNSTSELSSNELSFFSQQKNFEKTLSNIIIWKITYPDTLDENWIRILKILHEKTGLYPKVVNFF